MNPVLVALDVPTLDQAEALADRVQEHVGGFKVGLELLMAEGPSAVTAIAGRGLPVFADTKLHDIPNTVEKASRQIADAGARWITVHAAGGGEMLDSAVRGMGSGRGVLAVTVLTSLDDSDLAEIGISRSVESQVTALAGLASIRGAEGVVCSPLEVAVVKSVSSQLLAVTPGIRTGTGTSDDQKRIATPRRALELGADLLVVGRAITGSEDPAAAAAAVAADIANMRNE